MGRNSNEERTSSRPSGFTWKTDEFGRVLLAKARLVA